MRAHIYIIRNNNEQMKQIKSCTGREKNLRVKKTKKLRQYHEIHAQQNEEHL